MSVMHYDPHAIHQILLKIQEQMRCPQCSELVEVNFPSLKLAGDDFMILQLKCNRCQAFIVLHVTLTGKQIEELKGQMGMTNASSHLELDESELTSLRDALKQVDGSFEKLFTKTQRKNIKKGKGPDVPSAFT